MTTFIELFSQHLPSGFQLFPLLLKRRQIYQRGSNFLRRCDRNTGLSLSTLVPRRPCDATSAQH